MQGEFDMDLAALAIRAWLHVNLATMTGDGGMRQQQADADPVRAGCERLVACLGAECFTDALAAVEYPYA